MSRFYASIEGSRGPATRQGTPHSGMSGHVRGWHLGAAVEMSADGDNDTCNVYATTGSSGYGRNLIGTLTLDADGQPMIEPSAWLIEQVRAHLDARMIEDHFLTA